MIQESNSNSETSRVLLRPESGAIYFWLSQSKTISLLLGLTIALVASFIVVNDRSGKEQLFRKYISDAELQEYDGRYDRAALVWHSAIKLGTSLGDQAKHVADLHVRAAMAEGETSGQDSATENNHINDKKIRQSTYAHRDYEAGEQIKDLRIALSLYEKISNTTAEQISTLDKLTRLIARDHWEVFNRDCHTPNFVVSTSNEPTKEETNAALNSLNRGLGELKQKHPGLGISDFRKYLHETLDSNYVAHQLYLFAHKKPIADSVISDLIPLYHEVIYYSQSEPANFKFDQQMLDWAMTCQSTDPSNFKDRLNAGDLAFFDHDYHGATVEYLRCLGLKNDQRVRDKLINSLQLARKADIGTVEPLAEYTILLEKSLKLNQQAFGKNHHRVQSALYDLGLAHWITNHLTEAEYELRSIKLDKKDVDAYPSSSDVAYALADVYAKEGKCDEAVAQYRAGLALESEYEKRIPTKQIRDRIANAYICAGRFKESMQAAKQLPIEPYPSLTGSTNGFTGESGPFIE
jgi:tetratricopeptide (TPR) repeat protein